MNSKLRIGILLNTETVPAWAKEMIVKILAIQQIDLVLVIYNGRTGTHAAGKQRRKISFFYRLYRKLDNYFFGSDNDALIQSDISGLLTGIPAIVVTPVIENKNEYFKEEDITVVKNHNLDVLIKIGFGSLAGGITTVSKYGVWELYNSNRYNSMDGFAAVAECFNKIETTYSILHCIPADGGLGTILYYSKSMTDIYSVTRNLNRYYWKSMNFVPRLLILLVKNGGDWFWNYIETYQQVETIPAKYLIPQHFFMPVVLVKMIWRSLEKKATELFFIQQWQLRVFVQDDDRPIPAAAEFKKIVPPKTCFWADPHLIIQDNKRYVFFEELPFNTNVGHLAAFEIDEEGNHSTPVKILEKPFHLSNPFIMEYQGSFFMIPETGQDKTIQLYKCDSFPYKWEFVMNLMENINAVDCTLIFHDDTWWLFANVITNKGISGLDELFIFYSPCFPTNKWISHQLNPVLSDATKARPAGAFFRQHNKLYRPSQSSTKIYGTSIKINEVLQLNTEHYKERTADTIAPDFDKNILGVHSFSKKEGVAVIDTLVKRFRY